MSEGSESRIERLVAMQNPNGSWTNESIIKELIMNPERMMADMKDVRLDIIITFIVIEWITKHSPEKKYVLLLKKAKSWLKRMMEEAMIDEGQLEELKGMI